MNNQALQFEFVDESTLQQVSAKYARYAQHFNTAGPTQAPHMAPVVQFPVQLPADAMFNTLLSEASHATTATYALVLSKVAGAVVAGLIDEVKVDLLVTAMKSSPSLSVKRSVLANALDGYIAEARRYTNGTDETTLKNTMAAANLLRKPEFVDFVVTQGGNKKKPNNTFANIGAVLAAMGVSPQHNQMTNRIRMLKLDAAATCSDHEANDDVISSRVANAARWAGLNITAQAAAEAIAHYSVVNSVNPVRDWLDNGAPWDGTDRIGPLADTLVGATDPSLKLMLLTRWLIGAVQGALAFTPQAQQGALVLQGPQGLGKTTFFARLVPDKDWFKGGHMLDTHSKDSIMEATDRWITELGELETSFSKREIGAMRPFISADKDTYRAPYARASADHKRRTAFCATVNMDKFLVDEEGNRRWWTINVTEIKPHNIDIRQLWLQVKFMWERGGKFWLDKEDQALLAQSNAAFEQGTIYDDQFTKYLELPVYSGVVKDDLAQTTCVTTVDILRALHMKEDRVAALQAARVLRKMGFQYVDTKAAGVKLKGFLLYKDWMYAIEAINSTAATEGMNFWNKRNAAAAAK